MIDRLSEDLMICLLLPGDPHFQALEAYQTEPMFAVRINKLIKQIS